MADKAKTVPIEVPNDMTREAAQKIFTAALKNRDYRKNYNKQRNEDLKEARKLLAERKAAQKAS